MSSEGGLAAAASKKWNRWGEQELLRVFVFPRRCRWPPGPSVVIPPPRMAMYYYASKLSAVACGLRCKQQQQQQRQRRRKGSAPGATGIGGGRGGGGGSSSGDEDEDEEVATYRKQNGRRGVTTDELNLDEILHKKWNNQSVSWEEMNSSWWLCCKIISQRFFELIKIPLSVDANAKE